MELSRLYMWKMVGVYMGRVSPPLPLKADFSAITARNITQCHLDPATQPGLLALMLQ